MFYPSHNVVVDVAVLEELLGQWRYWKSYCASGGIGRAIAPVGVLEELLRQWRYWKRYCASGSIRIAGVGWLEL